jgi:hypothetical protein
MRVLLAVTVFFVLAVKLHDIASLSDGYRAFRQAHRPLTNLFLHLAGSAVCVLGAWVAAPAPLRTVLARLGLGHAPLRGFLFGLLTTLPMPVGFLLAGQRPNPPGWAALATNAGTSPFAEELAFRGLFFLMLYRQARVAWPVAALASAAVFGAVHLSQAGSLQMSALQGAALVMAITGLGGLLFSWLLIRWNEDLWIPPLQGGRDRRRERAREWAALRQHRPDADCHGVEGAAHEPTLSQLADRLPVARRAAVGADVAHRAVVVLQRGAAGISQQRRGVEVEIPIGRL